MNIQEMLGEAFHEGMTIDEINTALSGKKFADLSTGAYVDKHKYEADLQRKDAEIQKKAEELSARLTDDEKAQAKNAEKDELIKNLQQQIVNSNIASSKSTAESIMAGCKSILGIKDDDTSYGKFIDSIATDNIDSTKVLATYINKLVQDSYAKGKDDASKNNLGNFGKNVGNGLGAQANDVTNFGKQLAQSTAQQEDNSNLYFQK